MKDPSFIPGPQRYQTFDIYRTHYKKIRDHEIEVGILIPKGLEPGLHPVFVRFHGGGCVSPSPPKCSTSAYTNAAQGVRNMGVPRLVCKLACPTGPP
jgi:acetyl esterase/lipase